MTARPRRRLAGPAAAVHLTRHPGDGPDPALTVNGGRVALCWRDGLATESQLPQGRGTPAGTAGEPAE